MHKWNAKTRRCATVSLGVLALGAACKKTADGEFEVKVPKIETEAETLRTPSLEVQKETTTIVTPRIRIRGPGDTVRDTTSSR